MLLYEWKISVAGTFKGELIMKIIFQTEYLTKYIHNVVSSM